MLWPLRLPLFVAIVSDGHQAASWACGARPGFAAGSLGVCFPATGRGILDEDVVLAFVVVAADGGVTRVEVRDDGVDAARHAAVQSAGPDDYVLAVTAHSLVRVQPEPRVEAAIDALEAQ
jgi:hypothetical protein